ncbi:MAG TPA: DUF883 family protein [Rubrivivax sp.]|mgnify:FL=1|jgi:ElaB/YqjD/DUF883 family membrane-anchored ribosome-binding protein|nr:DUF883 domain-containing protein [Pseudomonadota bacterium]HOL36865.1 DUF883 family protein [Rubrivivax sp.]HPP83763.1 DUF883 family protein [Rubrivivax sp.]
MTELTADQKDKLISDLRAVIVDAEELLERTAGELGDTAIGLRERLQLRMASARDGLLTMQAAASERVKAAGRATDDYVHDHPWQSVGIGVGVGLLLGMLIARR